VPGGHLRACCGRTGLPCLRLLVYETCTLARDSKDMLMARVNDVAEFILAKTGKTTAMKLQKLVYYSQAWSLVWDEATLFPERIEARANGPVCPDLYQMHRGRFHLSPGEISGNPGALTTTEQETVAAIVTHYGKHSAQWLSELTHAEAPWREAREGLADGDRGGQEITHAAMAEYYGSL
jgi:uncharacterized phage-associated protein